MEASEKMPAKKTIFHQLLSPDATEGHVVPSVDDLIDEAFTFIGAATDTTGGALAVAAYHSVSNPDIYQSLVAELKEAFPDPKAKLDFQTLERLPYLASKSLPLKSFPCVDRETDCGNQRRPSVSLCRACLGVSIAQHRLDYHLEFQVVYLG